MMLQVCDANTHVHTHRGKIKEFYIQSYTHYTLSDVTFAKQVEGRNTNPASPTPHTTPTATEMTTATMTVDPVKDPLSLLFGDVPTLPCPSSLTERGGSGVPSNGFAEWQIHSHCGGDAVGVVVGLVVGDVVGDVVGLVVGDVVGVVGQSGS
jgi:hypothetical protein